jgi:hypothetical protein
MIVIRLVLGTIMLTVGSRLYWLFLGIVGFMLGFDMAGQAMAGRPHSVMIVVAVLGGLAGAFLAVFLQRLAIVAGGFFAGGYLVFGLLEGFGVRNNPYHWLFFVLGGIIGAFLMWVLFDWALIILSSGLGSVLVLQALPVNQQMTKLLFFVLLILGIALQTGLLKKQPHPHRRSIRSGR